jgi:hypothetical protein
MDRLAAVIVNEGAWLPVSMGSALLAVGALRHRTRRLVVANRRRILASMTLFFGVTIGMMSAGHLLAVTTKLAMGTLRGHVAVLYAIGVALAVPSWWLAYHTRRVLAPDDSHGRATLALNVWLGLTLLALGIHNLPLAVPALLNLAYQLHARRAWGWTIAGMAVVVNVALFVGSLMFLASGQSFEQFTGLEP